LRSGLSYTLEFGLHLRAWEDGKEVGGCFAEDSPRNRAELHELGALWLEMREVADARST
jgi:hypothetical protein